MLKFPLVFDPDRVKDVSYTTGKYSNSYGMCADGKLFFGIFNEDADEWNRGKTSEFFFNSRVVKVFRDTFGTEWSDDFHDAVVDRCKTTAGKVRAHNRIFNKMVQAMVDNKIIIIKGSISEFKQARLSKGLTLAQVAAKVKTSAGYIHDIENGRRSPSPKLEGKLTKLLKTS